MKKAVVLLLTGIVTVAAALLFFRPSQPPAPETTTFTTKSPTTRTVATTQTQAGQLSEVIVSNPLGSSSNTSMTFRPQYVRLVLGVNNTVTWVNQDTVVHTVTSATRLFDFTLQPRQRVSYTFTTPGVYQYTCTLHPWMTGTVEVLSRP